MAEYQLQRELVRHLVDRKKPLDAILVVTIGKHHYVVDGHHRYDAYKEAKWKGRVPVDYWPGPVATAIDEALRRNLKGKLVFTDRERREAAWTYTKRGDYSKAEVVRLTEVSDGTVATMRRKLREKPSRRELSWQEVARESFNAKDDSDTDTWQDRAAAKLAKQLLDNTGGKFHVKADILAKAIELINAELPMLLVSQWPDEAKQVAEQNAKLDI